MPRGGKRQGAGRKKGSQNKLTKARQEAKDIVGVVEGEMPLDFLLRVMRHEKVPYIARVDAAKAAAPYLHRKQPQAHELEGNVNHKHQHRGKVQVVSLPDNGRKASQR